MHYGNKDFSAGGRVTMRAYKPGVTTFGGIQVSGLDAIRVRKMYKCKGRFVPLLILVLHLTAPSAIFER